MVVAKRVKREQLFADARSNGNGGVDPEVLFGRASNDDLQSYTPAMLAEAARRARQDLARWDGETAQIVIEPVEGIIASGPLSVLSIVDRNKPFLYDSVMGEVTSQFRDIHLAVHPILVAEGDSFVLAEQDTDPAKRISYIQLHLAPLSAEQAEGLAARLRAVLAQVQKTYTDWQPMLSLLDTAIAELSAQPALRRKTEREESLAFLHWLRNDNFTFLGMREYVYSGEGPKATVERGKGRGLGILSDPDVLVLRQGRHQVTTTPEILAFLQGPDDLIVTKANVKSVVHRRAYMDYVGVKRFDENGKVVGELRIVGLFTATAYTGSVNHIPLLRAKAEKVVSHFGFDPLSHSGRLLQNTLESYPRDDLFQIDAELLARFCEQIIDLAERPRVRVLPRIDHFDRFVSLLVFVPREEYNSLIRERIGNYFKETYDGRVSAYYPAFPEGGVARVHFIIGRSEGKTPRIPQARLEEAVKAITTRWEDRFRTLAPEGAPQLMVTQAFEEAFSPEEAVADLAHVSDCLNGSSVSIAFHQRQDGERQALYLKVFHAGEHLPLSRRVPLLENLGFNVVSERTFDLAVSLRNGAPQRVVLHDMELGLRAGGSFSLTDQAPAVEEAFLAAFAGVVDNDAFNRLVLNAGLSVAEVAVLRAYAAYLRQGGLVFSATYMAETLSKYPAIAALLVRLFLQSFDPKLSDKTRMKRLSELRGEIEEALAAVPSLDEDRILRRYQNAIDSTLRTNYFQKGNGQRIKPMLAFKFDPQLLDGLPEPRPFREIFVYGTEVEGVHLRFGKVARGGLRWSDRAQDYRTEVLGLVKAQQVKNAVIVPVGAKGGFYPRQLPSPANREEYLRLGREAYMTYIRTLLSITDNIREGEVIAPADTVRLDGDDPYFVVAADKGTATFSDTANGLAREAGFWLDDAFASGGSAGYDHKKMGITARGAWEAVKRHFREINVDIQTTPFSVVGVGDMSGDVFGNGMLLSRKIRLIAAFDHRDIFIDPDPDMEKSFAERRRMFALPRSSWQDYDRKTLSKGAMIISRTEKSVKLTKEAAAAIGLEKTVATPFEIMTAILKADVDLLWFGGIGTYVKAISETDLEVGDRANDAIRVTADEVRAKVIGEGANLGVTQKGRIAFGLKGGRCNSDAIDNSAGVNSSDVEVNIKIALSTAVTSGRLDMAARNKLLASMTDEVAELVLRNNYLQSLAISLTERQGVANREDLSRLMTVLETSGRLNRKVETLPDDAALAERYVAGKALTRAEIGVLLSYAKISLFDDLVDSSLPDEPYCAAILESYFPKKMRKAHAADIAGHRLRREIIATLLANHVINRGGPGFIVRMADATGARPDVIVKAALVTRDGLDLPAYWDRIDALDGQISGDVQNDLYARIETVYRAFTKLAVDTAVAAGDLGEAVKKVKAAVRSYRGISRSVTPEDFAGAIAADAAAMVEKGVPEDLARDIADLKALPVVPDIMAVAERAGASLQKAAESYHSVTQIFRIGRLLSQVERITTNDHYDSLALLRSLDFILSARRAIVVNALTEHGGAKDAVAAWRAADALRINRLGSELIALSEGDPTLSRFTVAASLLTDVAQVKA
ncbi:NAD-glutamate dehydrogenase [Rhizobium paknamense]|uniref:Glutamate dehydrogenase n=1 Tax=Rhizobium paknamense TaxID=1206817 RepID=A0ABU0IJ02_9HYPH|nr:NAD-glutamate dehydrogenase [Rhizobium paknamense]MDQ0457400.1 glutamate dehydrogenase [Rhizobium paknamense]